MAKKKTKPTTLEEAVSMERANPEPRIVEHAPGKWTNTVEFQYLTDEEKQLVSGASISEPFPTETPSERTADGTDGGSGAGSEAEGAGIAAATQVTDEDRTNETGDDRDHPAESSVDSSSTILPSTRAERLPGESRNSCWERLRKMARAAGMPRGQGPGTAYYWADEQIARIFAPEPVPELPAEDPEPVSQAETIQPEPIAVSPSPSKDDGSVSGLSDLPPNWPELPANAQLQVEIAWVTANRLRVRDGTGVNLAKALSPAPSYSALSWLETSILFPAKFADISVKATAQQDDEREFIRREKMAIEEIRGILGEMLEAKD